MPPITPLRPSAWQAQGLGGLTIAGLWTLGVIAEIVVFALSPRFTLHPSSLMVIGGVSAVLRWLVTAQEPSLALLAIVQLGHGLTFGITMVGTMDLLVQRVPAHHDGAGAGLLCRVQRIVGRDARSLQARSTRATARASIT